MGCRKQWEQKSPWGWDRHSVAGRYKQVHSRLLFWAKEFKQALNWNREKASPTPTLPPHPSLPLLPSLAYKILQSLFAGLSLAVADQLVSAPASPLVFFRARQPAACVGGSAHAWAPAQLSPVPGSIPSLLFSLLSLHSNLSPIVPKGDYKPLGECLVPASQAPGSSCSVGPWWHCEEGTSPVLVALYHPSSRPGTEQGSASTCHRTG